MSEKNRTQLKTVGLVFVLAVILTACGGGSSLVGKWEGTDPDLGVAMTVEFKSDGTVIFDIQDFMTLEGTYRLVDANTLELTISFLGNEDTNSTQTDFAISGNTLTLTSEGSTTELHRVP